MAFSERLVVYVDAVTGGAVRGFQQTAVAAQAMDQKTTAATTRTQRFANALPVVATGALAVGAALYKSLDAYSEQERATLKLQNSLKRNPLLAGESADAFLRQAAAIQRSTVASDESVVGAQAMLATFRLTKGEIMGLTPLVVDYARKFDTDLVSASKQVGKAMDGQVGALKRNGVTIDETLFKTDRYRAVMEALRSQVGGFANEEANTAAGKIAQLKNNLGEIAEGIGAAVAPAVSLLADGLGLVADNASAADGSLIGIGAALGTVVAPGIGTLVGALAAPALASGMNELFGDESRENVKKTAEFYRQTGVAGVGMAAAIDDAKGATTGAAAANIDFDRTLQALIGDISAKTSAVWAGVDADMAASGATLSAQEAAARYAEVLADPASSPLERARAEYSFEQALIASAKANGEAAAQALTSGSANERAEASVRAQIDTLKFLAGTLAPESTLRANIEGYIAKLEAIPTKRSTVVSADLDWDSVYWAGITLDQMARGRTALFRAEAQGNFLGFGAYVGRQFGGGVSMGRPYLVGERGPELMIPGASGAIIPNSRLGEMGSGRSYSITVIAPANVDKAATGNEIVDAIQAYEARRGSAWRN